MSEDTLTRAGHLATLLQDARDGKEEALVMLASRDFLDECTKCVSDITAFPKKFETLNSSLVLLMLKAARMMEDDPAYVPYAAAILRLVNRLSAVSKKYVPVGRLVVKALEHCLARVASETPVNCEGVVSLTEAQMQSGGLQAAARLVIVECSEHFTQLSRCVYFPEASSPLRRQLERLLLSCKSSISTELKQLLRTCQTAERSGLAGRIAA